MDKYALAGKLVSGVVVAIAVNKIAPHVEDALDKLATKAKKPESETTE